MKRRKQILRIRPFNMANFSGAGGYIPMMAMYGSIFSFPATLLLWTGLAVSFKKEGGKIDYTILKRRLIRVVFPICIALSIPWIVFCINQLSSYGSDVASIMLAIWTSTVHSVGMCVPIFYAAKVLIKRGNLIKKEWFNLTFAFAIYMVISVVVGTFLLMVLQGLMSWLELMASMPTLR